MVYDLHLSPILFPPLIYAFAIQDRFVIRLNDLVCVNIQGFSKIFRRETKTSDVFVYTYIQKVCRILNCFPIAFRSYWFKHTSRVQVEYTKKTKLKAPRKRVLDILR